MDITGVEEDHEWVPLLSRRQNLLKKITGVRRAQIQQKVPNRLWVQI